MFFFNEFFVSSVLKILITAQEDTDNLQTDSDHDEDDNVDILIKVRNDNCSYDIYLTNLHVTLAIFACKKKVFYGYPKF